MSDEFAAATPPPSPLSPPPLPLPPPRPPPGVIYKVDSSRASFGELWRDSRSPAVLVLWLTKLLRVRVPGSVNEPNVAALAAFAVAPEQLPPDAVARLGVMVAELAAVGFEPEPVAHYRVDDLFNTSRTVMAVLRRADGRAIARAVHRTEGTARPPKSHTFCEFVSELTDGRFLTSTSARAYLDPPPGVTVKPDVGAAPARLWAEHDAATRGGAAVVRPAAPSPAAATDLLGRYHAAVRDACLARGLFRPMDDADLQTAAQLSGAYADAQGAAFEYPEVMVEVERLQAKRTNAVAGVVVLVVTVLMFAAAMGITLPGRGDGSTGGEGGFGGADPWAFTLLLIAVLFVHELGHFLAMRVFGYRNVSMFFIPFLGAAVKGQHFNVAGWKKVIVALMGPVPGVVLGIGLGIAGMVTDQPALTKAALLAVLLNGFNLLPVLPLDGGHVVHALLFVRHPVLDAISRVAAAAALVGISLLLGDRLLMAIGIVILIGVPVAYRLARIAADVRAAGVAAAPADGNTVPPAAARAIIARLKAAFPKRRSDRQLAQYTLNVYEVVNARPPGWLGSLGLGAVHAATVLLALAGGLVFAVSANPQLANVFRAAAMAPQRTVAPGQIAEARGPAAAVDAVAAPATAPARGGQRPARSVVFANFARHADAQAAFDAARAALAAGESAAWVGQTVLVACPPGDDPARRRWLAFLEQRTDDAFVRAGDGGSYRFHCLGNDDAQARDVTDALNDFLQLPASMRLIPPWADDDARTPEQRQQHARARRTLSRLMNVGTDAATDPQSQALSKRMLQANRRGDTDEAKAVGKELNAHRGRLRKEALDRLVNDPGLDRAVAERYVAKYAAADEQPYGEDSGELADGLAAMLDETAATAPATPPGGVAAPATTAPAVAKPGDAFRAWLDRRQRTEREMAADLGPLLGQRPPTPADLAPSSDPDEPRLAGVVGHAGREGLVINIGFYNLPDPAREVTTFLRWLHAQPVSRIRYDFGSGLEGESFDLGDD